MINSYLCTILCTLNFDFVSRISLWPTVSVTNTPSLLGRRKPSKDAGRRPAIQRVHIVKVLTNIVRPKKVNRACLPLFYARIGFVNME